MANLKIISNSDILFLLKVISGKRIFWNKFLYRNVIFKFEN